MRRFLGIVSWLLLLTMLGCAFVCVWTDSQRAFNCMLGVGGLVEQIKNQMKMP